MDIALFIVSLLLVAVPAAYWGYRLWRSPLGLHRLLMRLYIFFSLTIISTTVLLARIAMAGSFVLSDSMAVSTLGVLLVLPSLALVLDSLLRGRLSHWGIIALLFAPSLLYYALIFILVVINGTEAFLTTSRLWWIGVVGYNWLVIIVLFLNLTFIAHRASKCLRQVTNYYANRKQTDAASVMAIVWISLLISFFLYLLLVVSLESFGGNWALTGGLVLVMAFVVNYLGFSLLLAKGVEVPASFDWSPTSLSLEDIEAFELSFKQAQELLSAENATANISQLVEAWASTANPSYLQPGITLSQAAYEMKVPANILSSYINKVLGTNFNQWINSFRLKHVKMLLLTTNKNLDEIAELSGFTNRSFLSRTFKVHEGITPSEFRAKNVKPANSPLRKK